MKHANSDWMSRKNKTVSLQQDTNVAFLETVSRREIRFEHVLKVRAKEHNVSDWSPQKRGALVRAPLG
jgi:hypothetical protein